MERGSGDGGGGVGAEGGVSALLEAAGALLALDSALSSCDEEPLKVARLEAHRALVALRHSGVTAPWLHVAIADLGDDGLEPYQWSNVVSDARLPLGDLLLAELLVAPEPERSTRPTLPPSSDVRSARNVVEWERTWLKVESAVRAIIPPPASTGREMETELAAALDATADVETWTGEENAPTSDTLPMSADEIECLGDDAEALAELPPESPRARATVELRCLGGAVIDVMA